MLKKIIGFIAALWGFFILFKAFFMPPTIIHTIRSTGFSPYAIGQTLAIIFGLLLIFFGIRWLIDKSKSQKTIINREK